jgi:hypothetical protein
MRFKVKRLTIIVPTMPLMMSLSMPLMKHPPKLHPNQNVRKPNESKALKVEKALFNRQRQSKKGNR